MEQYVPLPDLVGLSQWRRRIWVPVPQVVEQVDQDDQVPHLPSGIRAVSLAMLLSIQISLKGSGLGSGNVP